VGNVNMPWWERLKALDSRRARCELQRQARRASVVEHVAHTAWRAGVALDSGEITRNMVDAYVQR